MAAKEMNPEEFLHEGEDLSLETPETPGAADAQPVAEGEGEHLAPPVNENFKWYIIHAYSGFERKVRESLESRIHAYNLQNRIGRIMIPTEPVTELRNGKKYTIERVFLPGYVLVEMELDNDLWHVIKNTPARHRLPWNWRQPGRSCPSRKSAPSSSAPTSRRISRR